MADKRFDVFFAEPICQIINMTALSRKRVIFGRPISANLPVSSITQGLI